VWPGTFNLADFLCRHEDRYFRSGKSVLELGTATGALAVFLKKQYPSVSLVTSDIDDGGDVMANVKFNCERNGG
jgi:methylase of polypeptide subunit release factors